ncbi:DNA phosphorothioation system sulfurtransferase DndC [Sphingobium sp. AS12]|uniref:DNA phosphorothioation system sulfurtransferase DndC n=1 Tax=Sphingobium sp. AS12 TaxID=2849495 RepID=UPI001C31DCF9|nr:DNA phosphorothioation system sulfurtransferase DndC [Sphingobium sp. AS12]MBV2149044.1 DNA phosphorothioation system sulfurtransferase DndC [Sphingobium sp. AS12]
MAEQPRRKSAFNELGFEATIAALIDEIQTMYRADGIPWVVGYSGGKDSSAVLQLIWMAMVALPADERIKPVYAISTDTLVENPIVATWVQNSLDKMGDAAKAAGIPLTPHRLTPEVRNSFWVNLIGRGYPAPRPRFRWCTERLKINPSNKFIGEVVRANGEAIIVLGTRKAESAARNHVMTRLEGKQVRAKLSPNTTLPNAYVYSPIADWSNDDVWTFLMQRRNPWGHNNKDLLTLYQGASADGECPLVIDSTTPSCGDSRFGCWVCTLVDQDRSMQAMIQNDTDKEWMQPLLDLRNALDVPDDRPLRDFRRMSGHVQLFNDQLVPGPYTQAARQKWLEDLLAAQLHVQIHGPEEMAGLQLITLPELEEIRRIWVVEKHEIEDSLPKLYERIMDKPYPGGRLDDGMSFNAEDIELLKEISGDTLHFELTRQLLSIERKHRVMARRAGVFGELERAIERGFYEDEADATDRARTRQQAKQDAANQAADIA